MKTLKTCDFLAYENAYLQDLMFYEKSTIDNEQIIHPSVQSSFSTGHQTQNPV